MTGPPLQHDARASYLAAFAEARVVEDVEAMATAAVGLASLQRFGQATGRTPALLHECYLAAGDVPVLRARLAAALARSWVYGNDADRGAPFAVEAVELAETLGDPALLADALDARLATCWGPDDLAERLHVTARLDDAAAHVDDVRIRLDAHLWRLTTALETLDVVGMQRQLAALDRLADDTGDAIVRYFATTRRAMHAVLTSDLDRARHLADAAYTLGLDSDVPDAYAVYHSQLGEIARQAGERDVLVDEAKLFEEHGQAHGIQSLLAQTAVLWVECGDTDRAGRLVLQVAGGGLDRVPADVDWLLTVSHVTEAAVGTGLLDIARAGMTLMAPYAGRAVTNAGAVTCVGVVDDYLARAATAVGDPRGTDWRASAVTAYRRLDAPWWSSRVTALYDVQPPSAPRQRAAVELPTRRTLELRAVPGEAVWSVGAAGATRLVPDMRGLHYLRALLAHPGVDISALDLSAMVAGHGTSPTDGDTGPRLDRQALAAYRQRLRDLDEEIDEAQSWTDSPRVERLETERDALLREIAGATGLHGRSRAGSGSAAERARVAVRKAIAAALERVETDDAATARLLRTTVRTGGVCRYDPDPDLPVSWQL